MTNVEHVDEAGVLAALDLLSGFLGNAVGVEAGRLVRVQEGGASKPKVRLRELGGRESPGSEISGVILRFDMEPL